MTNGVLLQDKSKICNAFHKYSSDIGNKLKGKCKFTTKLFTDYLQRCNTKSMAFGTTTEIEITSITKSLNKKCSFGLDQMSNRLVKSLIYTIRQPLMIVFNMSLASTTFSKLMKISKVQPLFKSGDHMLCNNYRPISLLLVLSKILEKFCIKE